MASLLSWLGNGVKRLENTVNNDVVKPIQRDVVRPVQGAVAQINPADSGRTYNTVTQQGAAFTPKAPMSVAQQIVHSGAANLGRSIVHPFSTIGSAVIHTPQMIAADITNNPMAQQHIQQKVFGTTDLGNIQKQILSNTAQIGLNAVAPGASKLASSATRAVLPKAVPKLVSHVIANAAVGAPVGGAFNTLNGGSFKQGAQMGALLGAGGTLAPSAAKVAYKGVKSLPKLPSAAKSAATTVKNSAQTAAEQNPRATAYDPQYKQFQVAYDNAPTAQAKARISKAMAANRQARADEVKKINKGGYASLPGNPKQPSLPNSNGKVPRTAASGSNAQASKSNIPTNHIVHYNGKSVDMGYAGAPQEQFKFGAQRIADNLGTGGHTTDSGIIQTPQGKFYEVSRNNGSAKPVSESYAKSKINPNIPVNKANVPEVPKAVYHTSSTPITGKLNDNKVFYTTEDKAYANKYGSSSKGRHTYQSDISHLNILDGSSQTGKKLVTDFYAQHPNIDKASIFNDKGDVHRLVTGDPQFVKHLNSKGYDGIKVAEDFSGERPSSIAVTKPSKLQLTQPTQGTKASSSGAQLPVSSSPTAGRYPSPTPKVSLGSELPGTTPKIVPPQLPGSRTAKGSQIQRQAQSLPVKGQSQLPQIPSPNYTPTRGFIKSVNQSQEVSPTVAKRASGTYQVRSTSKLAAQADQFASGNLGQAVDRVTSALGAKTGRIGDKDVANAIAVAKRLDANKNHAQATDIYEKLSEHLTTQGQSVQAASLLDRRTPEGIRFHITKVFKKAGVTPSAETQAQIEAKMGDIRKTKSGTPDRILATKQLQKIVADSLPSTLSDKTISFWKAGLLTGMRTQSGNLLSNETFSTLHNMSNPVAAALDKLISLKTGQRTKTLTGRGLVSGTAQGVKQGKAYLKTGIDERSTLTNKFDSRQTNFKHKALNTYVNGVFRLMGAADRPHYYRQLQSSLNDLAIADGRNQGLSGNALRSHIDNFVKTPPPNAFQIATSEAEKAVLANDTILSKAIGNMRTAAENAESPLGKAVTEAAINLIMPFTKVPSAFISRVIDFTPAGAIKTIAGQISRGQFDQRALVTAISEATTGQALMYLGYKLAQNNLLSGAYPNDPKEQQRWKTEGIQPNSIKVNGQWINMNYVGPLGLLFGAGGRMADTKAQGGNLIQQQTQAYSGVPKDLMQQSFLQGLSGAMQAVNDPGRYANNYAKSQAGSVIPTLIGDVATAADSKQRQTNGPVDAIKARVPGLRQTLNPAQDVYGNPLDRKTSPLSTMANPLRPTTDMSNKNPVVQEVNRLHNADPNNKDLQVTPTPINQTIKVEGTPVKLSNQQRYSLQTQVGQTIQSNWDKLIQTSEYKAMSDIDKAKAISNVRTDSTTLAERQYVTSNNLGTYNKQATAAVQNLSSGDLSKYLGKATSVKTPKAPKVAKAKSTTARGSTRTSTGRAKSVSMASYMKSYRSSSKTRVPKTTAPHFKASLAKTSKFKPVSLHQYRIGKNGVARLGRTKIA